MSIKTQANLPRVSVITPSMNQGEFLEDTILSVIGQDYPRLEYMVIDGGSQDSSVEILKKYSDRLNYWVSEPDRGQAHAINKGLIRSTGEYIGWINSDDTLTPGAINRIVDFLNSNPDVSLAYGSIYHIDQSGKRIGKAQPPPGTPAFSAQTMIGDRIIIQPGSFWRRTMMENVGLLNERYHHVFDYEFWIRIILSNGCFAQISGEPLANFRLSPASKSVSNIQKSGQEELSILNSLLVDPRLSFLNIPPRQLKRQTNKAFAEAYLKIYKGLSHEPSEYAIAWKYLFSAIRVYPIFILTRFPLILSVIRHQIHL